MDSGTGKVRTMFQGHSAPIFALTFSHDGRTLTSASEDGTVRLWDVNAVAEPTLYGAQPVNNNLSISPDSKTLAFVGFDGLLHLANLDSGTVQQANSVTDAAIFAPDGK